MSANPETRSLAQVHFRPCSELPPGADTAENGGRGGEFCLTDKGRGRAETRLGAPQTFANYVPVQYQLALHLSYPGSTNNDTFFGILVNPSSRRRRGKGGR